jgi:hypothetical protein
VVGDMKKRFTKYNNISCKCHQSHIHDSRLEADYCDQLALLQKAKEIKGYESQVSFDLVVKGSKICGHRVDFLVTTNANKKEVHETKGYSTPSWNIKRKLFEALFPKIDYIVVTAKGKSLGRNKEWKK